MLDVPPSQRRVTWAEVAEWLPDGEAEVAFDRDVAPSGLEATLYLFQVVPERSLAGLVISRQLPGRVPWAFELWAIDQEAPLVSHKHDVRCHGLSFPVPKELEAGFEHTALLECRCRVWRGPGRGWESPGNAEREQRAKRGAGLYMTVGGRAEYVGRR